MSEGDHDHDLLISVLRTPSEMEPDIEPDLEPDGFLSLHSSSRPGISMSTDQ